MNTSTRLASLTALALLSAAASAEVVCQNCTFDFFTASGGYLGNYWPGDKGTFRWNTQFVTQVSTFWVVDVNANGLLVFTASTPVAAQFQTFRAELYADWTSQCGAEAGSGCLEVGFHPEIIDCTFIDLGEDACDMAPYFTALAGPNGVRRWVLKERVVPGRYVLRILGQKGATATATYFGQVTLRK